MENDKDLGAFASTVPQKQNDLGDFASAVPAPPSPIKRMASDVGLSLARGIVGAPEALIGLADIPSGGAVGKLAEQAGIKTKETKNIIADYYSPEYKAAQEKVNTAEGFVPTVVAAAQNPSTIVGSAVESLPSMVAGGAIGRVARGASAMSPVLAGAIGEGAVSAGQTAEQVRQSTANGLLTPEQAGLAAASGAATGAINLVGGKIAQKLGIADLDTMLAGGAGQAGRAGLARRVAQGAVSEGLLEEAPQSYQEQVAQNLATGQQWNQGAANAAAQGALAGGLMGGGANIPGPITGAANKAAPEQPGASVPIKTMEAAQARANRMTTETGTPFEVTPHPTVGGSFTVTPVEVENGKPGRSDGTGDGKPSGAANAVMDSAVQPANIIADAGAGGRGTGDAGRNQPVVEGSTAGTAQQPDRVSGDPADAGRADLAGNVEAAPLAPPAGPIEAASRLAPQAPVAGAEAAAAPLEAAAAAAPVQVARPDGTIVEATNIGASKVNPADPASLRMATGFDLSAHDAANSPLNERRLSTPAQQTANNAKLGEADFQGLTVKVENPQGSVRSGVAEDKTPWNTLMTEHYGYIKGTKGADAAGVDTFVGPSVDSPKAFVVDQTSADGKFDEHKVMLGFNTLDEAKAAYYDNYQQGWQGGENISETTVDGLKDWLKTGETTQPFSANQTTAPAQEAAPASPAVAQAQAANVVPKELAVQATGTFSDQAAAQTFAATNKLDVEAVPNPKGGFSLAPKVAPETALSRVADDKRINELNKAMESEGVKISVVRNVTPEQRIVQAVADKAFGTRLTYVTDNDVFHGVAYKGDVYVATGEKSPLIPITFHEVSHILQMTDKKLASKLEDFVVQYMKPGLVQSRIDYENSRAPAENQIGLEQGFNETMADIGGAVAVDPNFWRKMAEHDESLFRKVAYKVMQMLTKAIRVAAGSHFDIDRMVSDRAAVQEAIAKAWGEYNSNRDKGVYKGKENGTGSDQKAGGQQTLARKVQEPAGVSGKSELLDAAPGKDNRAIPLRGLPTSVIVDGKAVTFGPFAPAKEAAERYRKAAGITAPVQRDYVKVDPQRARGIAAEFEDMKHDPSDPKVKASYAAMIKETLAQYQEIKKTGLKIELITGADPYGNPRKAIMDVVNNNHLWVYPTTSGFGGTESAGVDITGNPLLAPVDEKIGKHQLVANDVFRIVHDYFGHIKEGVGFRAEGEENAWQQHASMYSDLARPAMTTETRGQNSWVNFGPFAEFNKTANGADTQYAPQKVGLMPEWTATNEKPQFSRTPPDWINQVPGMTPEIAKKVGLWVPEKTLAERFNELKQDLGKKMVQGMVDQFAPIKALDMKAYMQARLSKASDGGLEAMLMYGKLGLDADGAITVSNTGGFIDSMKKLGVEQERFFSWVAGNRAAELKANGKENLFTDTDISALKNLNQGVNADGKNRTALYAEVLKDLNGFSKSILDIAEKSGLIDGNERHKWEKDFYVPFYRVLEDDGKAVGPRNLAGLTNQYAFKKLKGGKENLNDLMQNTVMNWAHLLSASLKNQAATTTLDAAQKLGVAHNVTSSTKGSVFVLKNGKEMHYVVDDPFITDAISSLAFSGMKGTIIDIATKAKRMLSFGVTFGPTYKIRNIIRDQLQAVAANPMSLNVAKNLATGIKYSSKDNPLYAQMLAGGGLFRMGAAYEDNRAQHLKNLVKKLPSGSIVDSTTKLRGVANKAYDAWMELGDRGETITRAAIYSQMMAAGASHLEASYNTRDSMDFGLQGAWPAVRLLTQTVPFMNARMQGLYKLGRAAKENPRRFATVLGATSIATIALMLASRDDEDWKRREEWDRDSFWWFKVGGKAIRIPKPFEIGAMASIAERGLDMILEGMDEKSRDRFAKRLYHIVMDNLSMNPVPQLVKPALDLYANKDPFRLRAIETPGMEKLSKSERIGGSTTGMAVMLGKAGVLSPVQIDYIISGYFGWLGSHIAMAADPVMRPVMGMPEKAERKIDDAFFVGDWVKELPSNQSRYVEEFYRQAVKVREATADMQHYKKLGNIEKAREIFEEDKELIKQSPRFNMATTSINKINLRIQQVQASSKMDAKQKRVEVDRLSAMRNKIAERVMK
jgi:hypothetical protein